MRTSHHLPAAATQASRRPSGAPPPSPRLHLLQARADASPAVARLGRLARAVIQCVPDVYSAAHFANPAAYLRDEGKNKVVEDGGSAGMSSPIYREATAALADARTRGKVIEKWQGIVDAIWANGEPSQPEQNRSAAITKAIKALGLVEDWQGAALFLRENSLRMAKGGIDIRAVRNPGTGATGAATHTFHRDSGFVTVAAESLGTKGAAGRRIATALNGPSGNGWVQGHSEIDNYKHRFIEHVHVNKGQGESAFEIYNGTKEDGERALAWGEEKADLLKPQGLDAGAVGDANTARRDGDLAEAKRLHEQANGGA